jgi:hypothetical protein
MAETPQRVIDLLRAEIPEKISLNQFCKKTGINPNSVDKYLAGMTEPTQASLQSPRRKTSQQRIPILMKRMQAIATIVQK